MLAKRLNSPYRPARSREWLKILARRRMQVLIGGFVPVATGVGVGGLLVGEPDSAAGGRLRPLGRVDDGFTPCTRAHLAATLAPLVTDRSPFTSPVIAGGGWVAYPALGLGGSGRHVGLAVRPAASRGGPAAPRRGVLAARVQGAAGVTNTRRPGLAQPRPAQVADLDEQTARAQTAREVITHGLACPHDDFTTCPNGAASSPPASPANPCRKPTRTDVGSHESRGGGSCGRGPAADVDLAAGWRLVSVVPGRWRTAGRRCSGRHWWQQRARLIGWLGGESARWRP